MSTVRQRPSSSEVTLGHRASAQTLVSEISRTFLGVAVEGIDAAIRESLGKLGEFLGADHVTLALVAEDGRSYVRSHAWDQGGMPAIENPGPVPLSQFPWLFRELGLRDWVFVPNPSALPEEARAEREELGRFEEKSAAWIPARYGGKAVGVVSLFWRRTHADVVEAQLEPLVVLGDVLVTVLRRKHAEEALRASEETLRAVTDAIPGAVYQSRAGADGERRIDFISKGAVDLFELPPGTLEADHEAHWRLVVPEDVPALRDSMRAFDDTLEPWAAEWRIKTPSGKTKWIRGVAVARRELDGSVLRHGILVDITERKRLEARLHVADRLTSAGTLAAGVAHEVNNPLSYVIGNLNYAIDRIGFARAAGEWPLGLEEIELALADAMDGGRRVSDIVSALRTFARADEDRGPVDVRAAIDVAVRLTKNEIRHRARLVVECPELPAVPGTDSRLAQVFVNLLVNAAQAMPDRVNGEGEIRITAQEIAGRVVVEVWDDGEGIPKDAIGRIFEPFFTTKAIGVGTGLGLSICHGIVTSLGGEIGVESEPGFGTLFRVTLPVAAPTHRAAPGPAATAPRHARVLAVDDEPLVLAVLTRLLEGHHEVVTASSAQEALVRLRESGPFDVVLCDLMMPAMNGPALYYEASQSHPETADRFLFLTGGAFAPDVVAFAARMANRMIDKPVDGPTLRDAIARILVA